MSITCALMSTSPSSNTANSPTGPPPMMTTSVSVAPGPVPCTSMFIELSYRRLRASELLGGNAHDEPVELRLELDLAGEAALIADVKGEIEHVLLHLRRRAGLVAPGIVDVDVAGGAGAGPAALGLDARHVIELRRLHERHLRLAFDHLLAVVRLNEGDLDHACVTGSLEAKRNGLCLR